MSTNHTGTANKPGTRPRRHAQVNPEVLALLHRAQHGDRDAFADLYLLTERPACLVDR